MNKMHTIIDGERVETSHTLPVINPYNGTPFAEVPLCGDAEAQRALTAADAAFKTFKNAPSHQRYQILAGISDLLIKRSDDFARTIALECGKPIKDARTEVSRASNTFRIAAEEAKRHDGQMVPLDTIPGNEGRYALVKRVPHGVVFGISPFNFPLNLVAHKVAPAIATGCTICLKPASKTPVSAIKLAEIALEAGAPKGVFNVLPCAPAVAEKLLADDRIKKFTFTGSAKVGWHLKKVANRKKVTLELGGNGGVYVDESCDLEYAATRCVVGSFSFAGQVCISVQRIYVHEKVFDAFLASFVEKARSKKVGDPLDEGTDIGPVIDEGAIAKTREIIDEALRMGGKLLCGGSAKGSLFEPTAFTNIPRDAKLCAEEAFAPLVMIEKVRDFSEGVARINDSKYGLQAGIFTNNLKQGLSAFDTVECGGVIVNDVPTFRVDHMPYGGMKESGFGREGVKYAMEEMTELKMLGINLR